MKELQMKQIASEPYSKTKIGNSEIPWKRAFESSVFSLFIEELHCKAKGW